jgi:hypothetical protein
MRYEFRVEGVLPEEARALFADMNIEDIPPQTLMSGDVIDESHLHGILAQLAVLGIAVVSVMPNPPTS